MIFILNIYTMHLKLHFTDIPQIVCIMQKNKNQSQLSEGHTM